MTHIEPDPGRSILDLPYDDARARVASLQGERRRSRSATMATLTIVDRVRARLGRGLIALGAFIAPSAAVAPRATTRPSTTPGVSR